MQMEFLIITHTSLKMVPVCHAIHGPDLPKTREFADHKFAESDKSCYSTAHVKTAQTSAEETVNNKELNTPNVSQTNALTIKF